MKKSRKILILLLAASMLLTGCVMRTADQLYCLPKRPQADDDLQKVIDQEMTDLSYCAPAEGENRQMIQAADLDGDGISEYIVLAKDSASKKLKLLIFRQLAVGYVLTDTIEGYGSTFDFITFANLDDQPGDEIIVGRQVVDGDVRSAAVYRLVDGEAQQLMEASYTSLLTHDLDSDGRSELVIAYPGNGSGAAGTIKLYRYSEGQMNCVDQADISVSVSEIDRIEAMVLNEGAPAVVVISSTNDTQTMEVFSAKGEQLRYVYGPISVEKLNGYFLSPMDADGDGDTDLPELVPILNGAGEQTGEYWIRWYSVCEDGTTTVGMYTYYSYENKWYMHMAQNWVDKLTVSRSDGTCTFSSEEYGIVMTIYTLTGSNRKEQAAQLGGIVLGKSDTVIFVGVIGPGARYFLITEDRVKAIFYPIELSLYAGEG